jgi:hypothetical protein
MQRKGNLSRSESARTENTRKSGTSKGGSWHATLRLHAESRSAELASETPVLSKDGGPEQRQLEPSLLLAPSNERPPRGRLIRFPSRMRFLRFALGRRHADSGLEHGPFGVAYQLRDSLEVEAVDRDALAEHLAWFAKNLETPTRFNRTKSKGFYRRKPAGLHGSRTRLRSTWPECTRSKAFWTATGIQSCGCPRRMLDT